MSAKSERKRRVYEEKKNNVAPIRQREEDRSPQMTYADDIVEQLAFHREECTDPNCDHMAVTMHNPAFKTVAMLFDGHTKEVFLAPFGRGSADDYKPHLVFQLETGDEIKDCFDANGKVICECCHDSSKRNHPICLTLACHRDGIDFAMEPDGTVSLVCAVKTCRKYLSAPNFPGTFKLAPRPKATYPNVFCARHGIEPSYAACPHVLRGDAYPTMLFPPTEDECGQAFCSACTELLDDDRISETGLKIVCQSAIKNILRKFDEVVSTAVN